MTANVLATQAAELSTETLTLSWPISLSSQYRELLANAAMPTLINHLAYVRNTLTQFDSAVTAPSELLELIDFAVQLREWLLTNPGPITATFTAQQRAILRVAVALHRRGVAERIEAVQRRFATPEQIAQAGEAVQAWDALLASELLTSVNPHPLPRLASYVTVHGRVVPAPELSKEETDPKHHVLLSSAILDRDLSIYRSQCEDRRLPFAVVYADVDDFKAFNTAKGEVYVDRLVLPPILNAIEAARYGHGRAYRHGGDEFVLLLPNAGKELAVNVATQVARAVAALRLEGLPHQPRLSIGIWITHPESHLTDSELVNEAANAKGNSKALGKNRITVRVERASHYEETVHEVTP
jgi:diguanylate cyclase (GGDEF)-like protein